MLIPGNVNKLIDVLAVKRSASQQLHVLKQNGGQQG